MQLNWLTISSIAMFVGAASLVVAESSNWPDFHGPGRTNISTDKNLSKKWPEGGPRLIWTYSQCGKGYSGIIIAEGKIFTAGDFGRDEMLVALDMDGHFVWKAANGKAWRGSSPGSRATPTYSDGAVYHMNPTGQLAAYKAASWPDEYIHEQKPLKEMARGWPALDLDLFTMRERILRDYYR